MTFIKSLISSMGRTLGRILVYLLIGLAIAFLFNKKPSALSYTGSNQALNDTYYNLFSGYVEKLNYKENYVAFSYSCSYGSYSTSTCYALCYGKDLTYNNNSFSGSCNYVKYDYNSSNTRELLTGTDNSFNLSSRVYYSNLGNSSKLKGGLSYYEKMVVLFLSLVMCNFVISRLFFRK